MSINDYIDNGDRFCVHCGAKLVPGGAFCYKCGSKVEIPEETSEVVVEPVKEKPSIRYNIEDEKGRSLWLDSEELARYKKNKESNISEERRRELVEALSKRIKEKLCNTSSEGQGREG